MIFVLFYLWTVDENVLKPARIKNLNSNIVRNFLPDVVLVHSLSGLKRVT